MTDKGSKAIATIAFMRLSAAHISLFASLGVAVAHAQVIKDCEHCPELVLIPAGTFQMGNAQPPDGDLPWPGTMAYDFDWERPAHQVHIDKPFLLGRTEVTRGQFAAFVDATGVEPPPGCLGTLEGVAGFHSELSWRNPGFDQSDQHPVVCVNRADAQLYLAWLSDLTGYEYRFPSD